MYVYFKAYTQLFDAFFSFSMWKRRLSVLTCHSGLWTLLSVVCFDSLAYGRCRNTTSIHIGKRARPTRFGQIWRMCYVWSASSRVHWYVGTCPKLDFNSHVSNLKVIRVFNEADEKKFIFERKEGNLAEIFFILYICSSAKVTMLKLCSMDVLWFL